MNLLRTHKDLATMLQKELAGVHNPRQSAAMIMKSEGIKGAHALVLFKDRAEKWEVLPVGEGFPLHNVGRAAHTVQDGKRPIALCYLHAHDSASSSPVPPSAGSSSSPGGAH